jgi:hypothetical protein
MLPRFMNRLSARNIQIFVAGALAVAGASVIIFPATIWQDMTGTLMKYTITFILLGLLLTGCGRRDAKIQQQLTGTWVETGDSFRSTRVVCSSGSFDFQITGLTNGITVKEAGTLLARDGDLIITVTNDSRTNASLMPQVLHGRVVRLDEHDLVVRWDGIDKDTVLQKARP